MALDAHRTASNVVEPWTICASDTRPQVSPPRITGVAHGMIAAHGIREGVARARLMRGLILLCKTARSNGRRRRILCSLPPQAPRMLPADWREFGVTVLIAEISIEIHCPVASSLDAATFGYLLAQIRILELEVVTTLLDHDLKSSSQALAPSKRWRSLTGFTCFAEHEEVYLIAARHMSTDPNAAPCHAHAN